MLTMLRNWTGEVEIDGVRYENMQSVSTADFKSGNSFNIKLYTKAHTQNKSVENAVNEVPESAEQRITVKAYMTRKATPEFDFMAKWNNDMPMPLRTMTGWVEKETRGMVYMHLHGVGEPVIRCLRCGKTLSNPISRHYGIGPECMSKLGIVADIEDVDTIKKQLVNVTWEGWIIKSAITEQEEVKND